MTDLLDPRLDRAIADLEGEFDRRDAATPAHSFLAVLLVGAGLVHAAMAPSHAGESTLEGAGFVAAAWLQLGLAVAVVTRRRRALLLSLPVNAALVVAWGVSRTAGFPFGAHAGHRESVTVVDATAVALEVMAVVLAAAVLAAPSASFLRSRRAAFAGALAALVMTSAAIASPAARDHAGAAHGSHGVATHGHDGDDDLGFAALSNGHQHERGVAPLTSDEMVALAGQLATTSELMAKYPTIAHAEAAGWKRAGPFSPGLGAHYRAPSFHLNPDGRMDREDLLHPMLVFDGIAPDAKLAGFMYLAYGGDREPEGFAGPNDHWHYHENVCVVFRPDGTIDTPFGADLARVTERMCTGAGGAWIASTGYMVHVWNVPGYESSDGMFSELNPAITCPDGTYHTIPVERTAGRDSTCRVGRAAQSASAP